MRCIPTIVAALLVLPACKGGQDGDKPEAQKSVREPDPGGAVAVEPPGPEKIPVTLQLNWVPEPEFGGFYAAASAGIYERAGLDVTIAAGSAGVQTWNMVATGKVPFAISSGGEVIRARLKDADLVAVYSVYQTSPRAIMVHARSGVTSLAEVFQSGKITRVAMEAGLPSVKFLDRTYGFDKVEVIQYGGNLSLFLQDEKMAQQAFIFSEPVSAEEQGVEVRSFSVAESGYNPYLAVVITSRAYLARNRAVVEKFVRASRDGWQMYLADPVPTNEYMLTQKAKMSLSAMKRAAELQQPYVVGPDTEAHYLGYMSEQRWSALASQLKELGEIAGVPEVGGLFVNIPPG